jgi:hypothetical protein
MDVEESGNSPMNILLLGDEHAYGYGLSGRQLSYMAHFIRQLSQTGRSVTVEAYSHLSLRESTALLTRLPLAQYDLIILQLGPDLIERNLPGLSPDRAPLTVVKQPLFITGKPSGGLRQTGNVLKKLFNLAASAVPSLNCPGGLVNLLTLLRPYRHNVLLMTPFPSETWLDQWMREHSRLVLLEQGRSQLFSVFDTNDVVQPRDEFFLTNDREHLNGVSHELIGRALFDFYQSAPTIVTVQRINRNELPY